MMQESTKKILNIFVNFKKQSAVCLKVQVKAMCIKMLNPIKIARVAIIFIFIKKKKKIL